MAKTLLHLGNQKTALGPCFKLNKWLFVLLIFLLSSLLVINCLTIGTIRILPRGNGSLREKVLEGEQKRVSVSTEAPLQITLEVESPPATGYLVRNSGCRIPDLSPFEPNIKKLLTEAEPYRCEAGTHPPLVESNSSAIFVNVEAKSYFYNETESVDCCWRPFWRTKNRDNDVTFSRNCYEFQDAAFTREEFVKVECYRDDKIIYRDYYTFVPRKTSVELKCQQKWKSLKQRSSRLSVLVVGIDSVSRINFHRQMPLTVNALKKLGAVEMFGYTKVAENTYPNLIPVFSGLSQEEFEKKCLKNPRNTFDECPLIWKNFSSLGYRTIFAEDACSMTTFNYLKSGFRSPPTDYYIRPFCIAAEDDIGNTHSYNANLCLGTRNNYESLIEYSKKVAKEFADDPYFGFIWEASLTHDVHEYPKLGDVSYQKLVNYLNDNELLKNAVFVFMSDHGIRWGSFRQTYQGRLEDSLPLFFIAFPDWWKQKYSKAFATLKRNSRSLTTHYDFHETLLDILHPNRLSEKYVSDKTKIISQKIPRGISMFLPVPSFRTCEMAGIPEHYCMCHHSRNVSETDPKLKKISNFLLTQINGMLKSYPQCATLKLNKQIDAKTWDSLSNHTNKNPPYFDYTVTIETLPGNAIFEGSVRYDAITYKMKLLGAIGRLNAYGKQSACVDNYHMRLYCYCSG